MTPTPKLTPAQRRVIDNLKAGTWWSLHVDYAENTRRSLLRRGLIERGHYKGMAIGWRLTEKGKSV